MKTLALVACLFLVSGSKAQNPALTPSTLSIPATVLHTNCPVTAGQTTYCFAGDGLWVSLNGAAFTQLASAGPGVISVNGKTGVVVLSATTQLQ